MYGPFTPWLLAVSLRRLQEGLGLAEGDGVIPYSSVTGEGRERLWAVLKERIRT